MPSKKTVAPSGLTELKSALKRESPANLYIFYGDEDYLRDYYLTEMRKKTVPDGMESFNLRIFQGKDLELQALSEAVEAVPMMSDRTLVLVYDWDLFKNEERRDRLQAMFDSSFSMTPWNSSPTPTPNWASISRPKPRWWSFGPRSRAI